MQVQPRRLAGFPEWLPGQQMKEREVIDIIRGVGDRHGYVPIATPAIERLDILESKGDISTQIYGVHRAHQDEAPEVGALRYDLTVPLARYVAEHAEELSFPFRRQQQQPVWRGERNQAYRFKEFEQYDFDVIGDGELGLVADAEMLDIIHDVFTTMERALRIPRHVIHVSNRRILPNMLTSLGASDLATGVALNAIDKLGRDGLDAVKASLMDDAGLTETQVEHVLGVLDVKDLPDASIAVLRDRLAGDTALAALDDLEEVVHLATEGFGVPEQAIAIDMSIVRGLNYYTGTVYETFLDGHPEFGAVCSGGRFDDLASRFTDRKFPGVGVSVGITRLLSGLFATQLLDVDQHAPTKVLVTVMDPQFQVTSVRLAKQLQGHNVATEVYVGSAALGRQLAYAQRQRIPIALIIGQREVERMEVSVRDLRAGEQFTVPATRLRDVVIDLLNGQRARSSAR